jgi:hypothetical protein
MKNNMLKLYGHVECMGDNTWPKILLNWRPERSKGRGRREMKWEKEVVRVMKKKNVNTSNQ